MSEASDLAALGIADIAHSLCRGGPSAEVDGNILPIAGAAIKLDVKTSGREYYEEWL